MGEGSVVVLLGGVLTSWCRHAELLAGHFTDARLRWVDESRTSMPIDQPDRLADHIEFHDQVPPGRLSRV